MRSLKTSAHRHERTFAARQERSGPDRLVMGMRGTRSVCHQACNRADLGADQIGLYQLHHVDPAVPLLDSSGALEALRREGKIAALGLSNVTVVPLAGASSPASISDSAVSLDLAVEDLADLRVG